LALLAALPTVLPAFLALSPTFPPTSPTLSPTPPTAFLTASTFELFPEDPFELDLLLPLLALLRLLLLFEALAPLLELRDLLLTDFGFADFGLLVDFDLPFDAFDFDDDFAPFDADRFFGVFVWAIVPLSSRLFPSDGSWFPSSWFPY
jgi:hypothetical protein